MKVEDTGKIPLIIGEHRKKKPESTEKTEDVAKRTIHTPSISSKVQADLLIEALKSYQESPDRLPKTTIQQVEAVRLIKILQKSLSQFEEGKDFITISKSGELVSIPNSDKEGFLSAFLSDLALLLEKSDGSSLHEQAFHKLVGSLVKSKTFSCLCPNWESTLSLKSQQSFSTKKGAEIKRAFLQHPSIENLADLIAINAKKPQEPPPKSSSINLLKGLKFLKEDKKDTRELSTPLKNFAPMLKTIATNILREAFPSDHLLKMAHARFHRNSIDMDVSEKTRKVLDGGYPLDSFQHFMEYDWKTTRALCGKDVSQINDTLDRTEKTLLRSKKFLEMNPLNPQEVTPLILEEIKLLKENESFFFNGGLKGHMILYEITKKESGFTLRVYNSGDGAQTTDDGTSFIVPEYSLKLNELEQVIEPLYSLKSKTKDQIIQENDLPSPETFLALAISKIIKKTPSTYTTHCLQDRGNCFWKAFSTWMHDQVKDVSLTVTQEMVEASRNKAAFATEELEFLEKTKEKIPLSRFMHRVAYEKVRHELSKDFSIDRKTILQKAKRTKLKIYSFFKNLLETGEKPGKRKDSEKYIFSLLGGIVSTPARDRYRRKGLKRREIKVMMS